MVAIAMRYLENRDDAEDVTQDALLKLWAMREMLRESEVDRLAFMVLKHLCINELKKREYKKSNNVVSIDSIDVALDPDNPQEIEERERQLMMAVDKLPSKQRQLLHMRYIKGKDVHTIAQITGSSEGSIKMALSRVRNKIYKLMTAVVAAICALVFPWLVDGGGDGVLVAQGVEQTTRPAMPPDASGPTATADSVCSTAAVVSDEIISQPTDLPRPRPMAIADSGGAEGESDSVASDGVVAEPASGAEQFVAVNEMGSLDRVALLAELQSSSPDNVYAAESKLPVSDISNRDRLRNMTLAIISSTLTNR